MPLVSTCTSPQLACLPWEYLYDATRNNFFALSTKTPIVRYLDLPLAESELTVDGPLQILVILSDPVDLEPRLDVEQEWNQMQAVFQELEEASKVSLHHLPNVTRLELQRYLREHKVDILHFIGHGLYDEQDHEGLLVFENGDRQAELVSADVLASLLTDRMPRLVYLNSCETARSGVNTSFAGTAQKLVQKGLPAAIAMQVAISDERAGQIAHEFYLTLIAGHPVDVALAEGRKAVFNPNEPSEWGTPVLFMRTPDGIIIDDQEILEEEEMDNPTQRWWDQLPQRIESSGGDVIIGKVENASGQTAIGKNITQSIQEALGEPTPDDDTLIEQAFAPLKAILPQLDSARRSFAEFQIELLNGELSKIDDNEMPSATMIIQVGDWLLENVPEMESALDDLLATPAVGRVLARVGEAAIEWVQRRFGNAI